MATGIIWPGVAGGGGFAYSSAQPSGSTGIIWPGVAGGGGRIPSSSAPLAGFGGCGGPGPGALTGLGAIPQAQRGLWVT